MRKAARRMCNRQKNDCSGCRARDAQFCFYVPGQKPVGSAEQFARIVTQWAKEHPVKTNREKLEEIFPDCKGKEASELPRPCGIIEGYDEECDEDCEYCTGKFWEEEYDE